MTLRTCSTATRTCTVEIGGTPILHGADLQVAAGELVAVVGPNGAGKSTLARAVAGLQRLAGGSVRWGERRTSPTCVRAGSRTCARSCRSARACPPA